MTLTAPDPVAVVDGVAQERRLVTPLPGPRSQALMARKTAAVAAGVGTTMPVFAARAAGGVVVDVDGNSLIDLGSGIAVTTVGSSAPRVVEAVQRQVEAFTHTCFMVTPYDGYVAVAEALNRLTPGDHAKRTALFNSGAEAVENAVKVARAATGRPAVVVFDHAYHGRTNLTMAMTAKAMPYKLGGPFAAEVYRAPLSYPFRDGPSVDGAAAARRAIDVIEKQVGAAQVACLVIEPVQGEGGFITPAPGFLPALAQWCRDYGVVLHRRRGADRLRPHRRPVRLRPRGRRPRPRRHRQGHRRRAAAERRHRTGRAHGRRARRRPRRHVRRQPAGLRRRARRVRDRSSRTAWSCAPARSAGSFTTGCGPCSGPTRASATSAGAVRCSPSSSSARARRNPTRR